jgi:hypothetical protein
VDPKLILEALRGARLGPEAERRILTQNARELFHL